MTRTATPRRLLAMATAGLALIAAAVISGPPAAAANGPGGKLGTAYETVADHCAPVNAGALYGLRDNGELTWNKFTMPQAGGSTQWAAPKTIATGWTGVVHFFADGGTLYTIDADGILRWHGYTAPGTGDGSWKPGSGSVVGYGWDTLVKVAYAGSGIFYGTDTSGNLKWYRHTDWIDGGGTWEPGSSKVIDDGWGDLHALAATGPIIYAAQTAGTLRWYRYDGSSNGEGGFAPNSGAMIDDGGWQLATSIQAHYVMMNGLIIRTLDANSTLRWYWHTGWNTGDATWHPRSASISAPTWPIPSTTAAGSSRPVPC